MAVHPASSIISHIEAKNRSIYMPGIPTVVFTDPIPRMNPTPRQLSMPYLPNVIDLHDALPTSSPICLVTVSIYS